jgi:hypothetical protein
MAENHWRPLPQFLSYRRVLFRTVSMGIGVGRRSKVVLQWQVTAHRE